MEVGLPSEQATEERFFQCKHQQVTQDDPLSHVLCYLSSPTGAKHKEMLLMSCQTENDKSLNKKG